MPLEFIVFSNSIFLIISDSLQFENDVVNQNLIVNMRLLTSKLNVKDFDENAYMGNIKDYKNIINLINHNDSKEVKSDKCLNNIDYKAKYETNKNIENNDDNLFIVSLS